MVVVFLYQWTIKCSFTFVMRRLCTASLQWNPSQFDCWQTVPTDRVWSRPVLTPSVTWGRSDLLFVFTYCLNTQATSNKLIKSLTLFANVFHTCLWMQMPLFPLNRQPVEQSLWLQPLSSVSQQWTLFQSHLDLFLWPSRYKMITSWACSAFIYYMLSLTCHRVDLYSLCFFHSFLIYSSV